MLPSIHVIQTYLVWGIGIFILIIILDVILTISKVDLPTFYKKVCELEEKADKAIGKEDTLNRFVMQFWSALFLLWRIILWPIFAALWLFNIVEGKTTTLKIMSKLEKESDKTKEEKTK